MKLIYIRYNKHYPHKLEELIQKYKSKGEIISKGVTSGKKLLKKEIKEIESFVKEKNIEKLYIVNLDEMEISKLLHLGIKIEIISEEKPKNISNKLKIMFELLKELSKRELHTKKDFEFFKDLMKYDERKLDEKTRIKRKSLEITTTKTTFLNYLNDLKAIFPDLIKTYRIEDGEVFKFEDGMNFVKEIFQKEENLEEITILLTNLTDDLIQDLSKETQKFIKSNKNFIIYKNRPFEKLEDNFIFVEFKRAILEKRYIDIKGYGIKAEIEGYKKEDYEKVIPLKMVFMENNWYLAGVVKFNDKNIVRFFRLNFVDDFEVKEKFSSKLIKKEYLEFLENFETPFTLYGVEFKKAKIKVLGEKIIPYFKLKNHFPKQNPVLENENELILEIGYTQPLEVLPIIKKWLPNIEILESENDELQTLLIEDLEKSLSFYKK